MSQKRHLGTFDGRTSRRILTRSCNGVTAMAEVTEHTIDRGDGARVQLFGRVLRIDETERYCSFTVIRRTSFRWTGSGRRWIARTVLLAPRHNSGRRIAARFRHIGRTSGFLRTVDTESDCRGVGFPQAAAIGRSRAYRTLWQQPWGCRLCHGGNQGGRSQSDHTDGRRL